MGQQTTFDIDEDIIRFIEENGVDTGNARRVNYSHLVMALEKKYCAAEIAAAR